MQEYEDGKVEIELVDEVDEVEQIEQGEDQGDVQVKHAKHDQDTGGNSDMIELRLQYCTFGVKIQETTELVLLLVSF